MLTCQILIQNERNKIGRLIESLAPFVSEFLIVNLGSQDGTNQWCADKGLKVLNVGQTQDRSRLRNALLSQASNEWQLLIHPWEVATDGDIIKSVLNAAPKAYSLPIVQGNMIVCEPRLWHRSLDLNFKNPICECLDIDDSKTTLLKSYLYSDGEPFQSAEVITQWREQSPMASEPLYYEAFFYLSKRNWERFLSCSTQYLFDAHAATKATITMKYYTAVVLCFQKKDTQMALKHVLECLAVKPLMAEYWCLLGDIYYHNLSDKRKAKQFYRNAVILGSKRSDNDMWPIELPKYKEYPEKMIESCKKLLHSKSLAGLPWKRH